MGYKSCLGILYRISIKVAGYFASVRITFPLGCIREQIIADLSCRKPRLGMVLMSKSSRILQRDTSFSMSDVLI